MTKALEMYQVREKQLREENLFLKSQVATLRDDKKLLLEKVDRFLKENKKQREDLFKLRYESAKKKSIFDLFRR